MLLILVIQFNSFMQPFIILSTLIFAMLGVNFGLFITSTPRSLAFILGIIALMGIVVNDAIIMVDQINNNRRRHIEGDKREAMMRHIFEAGESRFIPIVLTTLTTAAGIVPLVFVDTFWAGLSYTVIFGLCMASFLTLFITPVIYYQIEYERAATFLPLVVLGCGLGVIMSVISGSFVTAVVLAVTAMLSGWWTRRAWRRLHM